MAYIPQMGLFRARAAAVQLLNRCAGMSYSWWG